MVSNQGGIIMFGNLMHRINLQRRKRRLMGDQLKITYKYKKGGLYHDKVEKTEKYKRCIAEVEKLAEIEASKTGHEGKGYCHIVWGCKKQILMEKFNIDWRSPAEMNPHCKFD